MRSLIVNDEIVIHASASKVWEVLVNPIYVKRWDELPEDYPEEIMGVAEEMDGQYTVTHVMGEGIAALEGAQFSQGEGFLGRALLTGEIDHWENIERDPRSIFFKRHQFKPKSLLCYPIRQDNQSTKLLFCGNSNHAMFSTRDLEIGRTLGIMLESHLAVNSLQHENDEQLRRLGSLIEICKLMVSVPDIKKIAYILVDIGLNLVEGTFSCLILKETNNKIKLVSRGNASGDIAMYAKDVVKRYLTDGNGIKFMSPQIHETAEGEQVIECPLFTNGYTHGVLSVGIANNTEAPIQEHLNFLGTLSIIGGVSLQLARTGEENYEENQANALYRAIGQFDPEAYKENGEAANLAGLFAMRLGLDAAFIKEIVHACYLSTYEPEFIQELFPDKRISLIVKEQNRNPRTIILSTHLVSEMEYLFDEIIIIDKGAVVIQEDYETLTSRGASITGTAEIVDEFAAGMQQLNVQQLGNTKSVMVYGNLNEQQRQAAQYNGLEIGPVSLQELFIHLTGEVDA